MTIGIGFVARENFVVLASDSQMTWPGYKQEGYEKVVRIYFKGGHFAGLVKAGDWEWANLFHENLEETANAWEIKDETSIRRACESALVATRQKILAAYFHPALQPGAANEWLKSRPCHFLAAYVFRGKTFFYTMDLIGAIPSRVFHPFAAIGSGSDLAAYFLNNLNVGAVCQGPAPAVAIYIIQQCIKHSEGCGGPIQLSCIDKSGNWQHFTPDFIDSILGGVRVVEIETAKTLSRQILSKIPPSKSS